MAQVYGNGKVLAGMHCYSNTSLFDDLIIRKLVDCPIEVDR